MAMCHVGMWISRTEAGCLATGNLTVDSLSPYYRQT